MKVLSENLKRKKQKLWNKIQKIHQRLGVESESKAHNDHCEYCSVLDRENPRWIISLKERQGKIFFCCAMF